MTVRVAHLFETPHPGQFAMIRIAGLNEPFLSRPFSIYSFSRGQNNCSLQFLYQVVGKGTQILAGLISGSQIEINGPLGNGFDMASARSHVVLLAGGIGIAPLFSLMQSLAAVRSGRYITLYFGAKSKNSVIGIHPAGKFCNNITICTDDGTEGEKGLITQVFRREMRKYKPEKTSIYACGPKPMLKSLALLLLTKDFDCQVSLEERMACGTGACMGCVVALRDERNRLMYQRVCADGPIFNLRDILWE